MFQITVNLPAIISGSSGSYVQDMYSYTKGIYLNPCIRYKNTAPPPIKQNMGLSSNLSRSDIDVSLIHVSQLYVLSHQ